MKKYGILDNITSPADLRGLSYDTLGVLCAALRAFIVDSVSRTGGHLASNLGVVELAVALEREFDSSRDRIIYDVGHQSYVHKILMAKPCPPSADRNTSLPPSQAALSEIRRSGAKTNALAVSACAQIGITAMFSALGSITGPPADRP